MAQIQKFFFKAMLEGWARGSQKIKLAHMPGFKAIPFRDGNFYLLDWYCVGPGCVKSTGTTTIWYKDVPVWFMSYNGYYEEPAISFLKSALNMAYEADNFVGGRGPRVYTKGPLVYTNRPSLNDFTQFYGYEDIADTQNKKILGYHKYWGASLI